MFPAKSEIQRVFCILPDETQISKPTIQKVLRTLNWKWMRELDWISKSY